MSYEVVGDKQSLGQFASNKGYADLIHAARDTTAAKALFASGESDDVESVIADLGTIKHPPDVAETAHGLAKLIEGQESILITDGLT